MKKSSTGINFADWWYDLDKRVRTIMIIVVVAVLLTACVGAGLIVRRILISGFGSEAEVEPTTTPLASETTTPTRTSPAASSTNTPVPTWTPEPDVTEEPSPTPTTEPSNDLQGDVGLFESGDPVEETPAGIDILAASIAEDLSVTLQPATGIPGELTGWASQDEVLLWVTLYEPIPDPPAEYMEWLFALDLDGDVETGRAPGSSRINPDIGMEIAIALFYSPETQQFATYFLAWNANGEARTIDPASIRYTLNEARTLIGLALPLETLSQVGEETSGVTLVPGAVQGRAAAWTRIGQQRVIDFYPDRPE